MDANMRKKPAYSTWQTTAFMIRTAWRSHKGVLFMCVFLSAVTAALSATELLIAPSILKKVENAAPIGEMVAAIALFSGALLVLTGLKSYLESNTLCGRVSVRMAIVAQISNKIARTSYPNILDTRFVECENKASETCYGNMSSAEYIWTTLTAILTNVIGFLVYLSLLSDLNPFLICLAAGTAAGAYFASRPINKWGYAHREEESAYSKRMRYLHDSAKDRALAKDLRIFGLKSYLLDVFNGVLKRYRGFIARREKVYLWTNVIDLALMLLRNGVSYAYLIKLALDGRIGPSEFLLYFGAVTGFTAWVTGILEKVAELNREGLELSIVCEFLNWPEPFKFEEGAPIPAPADGKYEIRLKNVSFRYPGAESDTLSGIDLTLCPGEKLAIVGLNGAGKTTLIKLICGFLDPTRGRVLLNGQDIRRYNRRNYYELFSAVFQDFSVIEGSIALNVAQKTRDIDVARVWECLDKAGLAEKVRALPGGLETNIGRQVYEDGVELSGGEMQRLMMARALYKGGAILALDEPTAALDPIAENDVYLKYNAMASGRTALFISHRLASTRFCDRILYLSGGAIAEEGDHAALMEKNGGYAKLFEVQSQYYREGGDINGEKFQSAGLC